MQPTYRNDRRCARCQARDRELIHDVCLDCITTVYMQDGNWCDTHGVFPLALEMVEPAPGVSFRSPKVRDEQRCPWCESRCAAHHTPLSWGDYCVQCAADAVAGDREKMRFILEPREGRDA